MGVNVFLSFLLIVSTIIMLSISFYSWKRRKIFSAASCSAVMFAASFYSFGYAFEIISTNLEQIKFWLKVQYVGIPFITVLWLMLVMQHSDYNRYFKKWFYVMLFIVPSITLILHISNDYHHLFYINLSIQSNPLFTSLVIERGSWYWVHLTYSYLNLVVGITLYIVMYIHSKALIRKQILIILTATCIPWVINVIYTIGSFGFGFDLGPFGFAISGLLYMWGIYKYNLLTLSPIALEKVFEFMRDGIIILDFENNIVNYNNSAKDIISELESSQATNPSYKYVFHNYPEIVNILDHRNKNDRQLRIDKAFNLKYYNISLSTILEHNHKKLGKILVLSDTTVQNELLLSLEKLASLDDLTQLYNRRVFNEKCEIELERSSRYGYPLAFILCDIDHFKIVNDTYGHYAGDIVLKQIAAICRDSIRTSDIIARLGGEEFGILLPHTSCTFAVQTAERLRCTIANTTVLVDGIKLQITASFGVCILKSELNESIKDLFIRSDKALYQAKAEGRNKVVWSC